MGNGFSSPSSQETTELTPDEILRRAVIRRDRQKVEELLTGGLDATPRETYMWNPRERRYKCVKSAFRLAIEIDDVDTVKIFLSHGVSPDLFVFREEFSKCFQGPIIEVAHDGAGISRHILEDLIIKDKVKMAETLLNAGVDINRFPHKKYGNLLGVALSDSRNGRNDMVKALIRHGARLENKWGINLLFIALGQRNAEAMGLLLRLGADPNAVNARSETPLHIASSVGDVRTIEELARARARLNIRNANGDCALHIATILEKEEAVMTLIRAGANPDCKNRVGDTPTHIATSIRNTRILNVLLRNGANPDVLNFRGVAPLHIAAQKGNFAVMKMLLDFGAEPELPTAKGERPIDYQKIIIPEHEEEMVDGGSNTVEAAPAEDYAFSKELVVHGAYSPEIESWEAHKESMPTADRARLLSAYSLERRLQTVLDSICLINYNEGVKEACELICRQISDLSLDPETYFGMIEHLRSRSYRGNEVTTLKVHYNWRLRRMQQQKGAEYFRGIEGEHPLPELPDDILRVISDLIYKSKWGVHPKRYGTPAECGHNLIDRLNQQRLILRRSVALGR